MPLANGGSSNPSAFRAIALPAGCALLVLPFVSFLQMVLVLRHHENQPDGMLATTAIVVVLSAALLHAYFYFKARAVKASLPGYEYAVIVLTAVGLGSILGITRSLHEHEGARVREVFDMVAARHIDTIYRFNATYCRSVDTPIPDGDARVACEYVHKLITALPMSDLTPETVRDHLIDIGGDPKVGINADDVITKLYQQFADHSDTITMERSLRSDFASLLLDLRFLVRFAVREERHREATGTIPDLPLEGTPIGRLFGFWLAANGIALKLSLILAKTISEERPATTPSDPSESARPVPT